MPLHEFIHRACACPTAVGVSTVGSGCCPTPPAIHFEFPRCLSLVDRNHRPKFHHLLRFGKGVLACFGLCTFRHSSAVLKFRSSPPPVLMRGFCACRITVLYQHCYSRYFCAHGILDAVFHIFIILTPRILS